MILDEKNELLEIAEEYIRVYRIYQRKGEDIAHNDLVFLYWEFLQRVKNFKEKNNIQP